MNAWLMLGQTSDVLGEVYVVYTWYVLGAVDEQLDTEKDTRSRVVTTLFVIAIGTVVTVLLLNVLITILGNKYNHVADRVDCLFVRFRAKFIYDSFCGRVGKCAVQQLITCEEQVPYHPGEDATRR